MEYYKNRLCISMRELVDGGVMTESAYGSMTKRKEADVVRRGCRGRVALVAVSSLPDRYREAVRELTEGDGNVLHAWFRKNYEVDQRAVVWYNEWATRQKGASQKHVQEYVVNASVLNTCIKLYRSASSIRKTMGCEKYDWVQMQEAVEYYRQLTGHTLPESMLRFRKRVVAYMEQGYESLLSGKFGNQNTRKVSHQVERLVLAIAVQPNKPWNTSVWEMYNAFVTGEHQVWDWETGELLNPDDFCDRKGDPLQLSESTINNILNDPKNQILVRHATESYTTFMHEVMPHMHRHAAEFSLSKISFDDRDLPRKLQDTKARPKAYYAYDVASQCVVGFAYNRKKNVDIVLDCFRSMFALLDKRGWGCPAEIEVENHLMSQWRESFLKAGELFPFVHFCAPMNSQEKYAEQMNGSKKRTIEKKNHLGIGRFYAKQRAYRTESKKVFDELNDTYEEREYYSWEQLIAEDMQDVMEFNNSLHPNQKKYPGMTRWEVLESNINPELKPLDKASLSRFIGVKVETSIRRNSYCRVMYKDWWLSSVRVMEKLKPGNVKVDAYCLMGDEGEVQEVYIWQGDRLIDKLEDLGTYNTATAEQTEQDREIYEAQCKKIAQFKGYVNEHKVAKVGIEKVAAHELRAVEDPPGADDTPEAFPDVVPDVIPEVYEGPSDGVRTSYEERDAVSDI